MSPDNQILHTLVRFPSGTYPFAGVTKPYVRKAFLICAKLESFIEFTISRAKPEPCYAKSMSDWFAPICSTPGKRCAVYFVDLFGSFDSQRPGKHFYGRVGTGPPLPGYYQHFWGVNLSCSRTQHSEPSEERHPNHRFRHKFSAPHPPLCPLCLVLHVSR